MAQADRFAADLSALAPDAARHAARDASAPVLAPLAVKAGPPFAASRRVALKGGAAVLAGLVLGVHLAPAGRAQGAPPPPSTAPNVFLRVGPDGTVTVLSKHIEFGQGPWTGLTTLVAEELDADWAQMRAEHAPGAQVYANNLMGLQLTGGSTAIANSYEQMRRVGATARAMLVSAAAEAWGVPAGELRVEKGVISHPSGRRAGFGEFAEAAARRPAPDNVTLKDPARFTLIGRDLPKPDTLAKTTGRARFAADIREEGMVTAVVLHPPRFGAKLVRFDDAAARAVDGVLDVKAVPQGVAIYARSTWPALKARDLVRAEWDDSRAFAKSSESLISDYTALSRTPGAVAGREGDAEGTLRRVAGEDARRVAEETYVFPYLAHAPMEPLDGVIRFDGQRVHASFGSQGPGVEGPAIAKVFGVGPEAVRIEVELAGGSFGRRVDAFGSFASELAEVGKAYGRNVPVKLVWTREDDIKGGWYRPLFVHRMRGALNADGSIAAWHNTIVGQSIMKGTPFEPMMVKDGIDPTSVEGANDLPYKLANFRCDLHTTEAGVPVLWWRSVGHTHTAYATETFLDLLLARAGKDPVEGRLALLDPASRDAGVLRAVAAASGWRGIQAEGGRMRGIAVHKSFNTYVAQVAEVSRGADGLPKVHKVWCAVDCGVAVNPNVIRAQMEGGIGYGLGHALYGEIELGTDGRVSQSNFHDYRSLRIGEMPAVEVVIVNSSAAPTGVGEPGVPPAAPAVANAWRALTGQLATRLPFSRQFMA